MKDGFDSELFRSNELLKRGGAVLIANIGKTVAIITLIVAVLLSFTDVSFSRVGLEDLTTSCLLILMASYIMYFSLEDAGEKLGREGDEYKDALSEYRTAVEQIADTDIDGLRSFLLEYRRRELEYRRLDLLVSHGYSASDYEAYKRGEAVTPECRRVMRLVKREKSICISASDILSHSVYNSGSRVGDPSERRLVNLILKLIPSTLGMLFTVSLMVSLKSDMSAETVIEGILKLSPLPLLGLKGYTAGYEFTSRGELLWLNTKTGILKEYLSTRTKSAS